MYKTYLTEVNRATQISDSRSGKNYSPNNQHKGKNRYERRTHQKVSSSVASYNELNMNKFFKEDILDVVVKVNGETNNYDVKISFSGVLDNLKALLTIGEEIQFRDVSRALIKTFNDSDIFVHCTCPDWKYRHGWWAVQNNTNSDADGDMAEYRKAPRSEAPDITNPDDDLGGCCKHVSVVLSNNSWLIKVSSVIRNYINYMKNHQERLYQKIIFPALYDQEYDPQLELDDFIDMKEPELDTSKDEIDISNKWARTKNQIQPGWNKQGSEEDSSDEIEGQKSFDFDSEISD